MTTRTPAGANAAGVSLFFGTAGKYPIAMALAVVALFASGCQLARPEARWTEQTTFVTQAPAAAKQHAQNWAAAEPTRRAWSYVGTTGSMLPTLQGGDILLQRRPRLHEVYVPGTMIIWMRGTSRLCLGYGSKPVHRVVAVRGNAIYVRGDACAEADGWFSKGTVEWVVEAVIRQPRSQTR